MLQTTARIGPFVYNSAVFRMPDQKVYLTFDDGPHPETTPELIELLAESSLSASFFCLGHSAQTHPELISLTREAGHVVGGHGMKHRSGFCPNAWQYKEAVQSCEATGSKLYRPPYGRMPLGMARRLKKRHGITTIMWEVMTYDFDDNMSADQQLAKCREKVRPGSIIVMHDQVKLIEKHREFLPKFKELLDSRGLTSGLIAE